LQEFYGEEYQLNRLIKTYSKPYIALLDGITMGGGVGISVHGDFRVATENTLFAMPETGIGFFPDVGGTYFLPRLPGKIGMYLALTGARLKAADMIFAGLATHYVPSARLPEVQQALAAMPVGHGKSDAVAAVNAILNMYHEDPDKSLLRENYDAINQHFSGHSVEEIVENLRASTTDFAQKTLKILLQKSPSALKVTYRQMQVGAILDFDRAMQLEYRLACGIACDADFAEGVRAVIVDKDQNPKWSPGQLSDVSAAYVDQYFDVLGTPDLTFTAVDG
jgi:enoyl-CoA hydratase